MAAFDSTSPFPFRALHAWASWQSHRACLTAVRSASLKRWDLFDRGHSSGDCCSHVERVDHSHQLRLHARVAKQVRLPVAGAVVRITTTAVPRTARAARRHKQYFLARDAGVASDSGSAKSSSTAGASAKELVSAVPFAAATTYCCSDSGSSRSSSDRVAAEALCSAAIISSMHFNAAELKTCRARGKREQTQHDSTSQMRQRSCAI